MVAPFAVCKNPENQILAHDENLTTTYSVNTLVKANCFALIDYGLFRNIEKTLNCILTT